MQTACFFNRNFQIEKERPAARWVWSSNNQGQAVLSELIWDIWTSDWRNLQPHMCRKDKTIIFIFPSRSSKKSCCTFMG